MSSVFSPGFFGRLFTSGSSWALTFSTSSPLLAHNGNVTVLPLEEIVRGKLEEGIIWSCITVGEHTLPGLTNKRGRKLIDVARKQHSAALAWERKRRLEAEDESRRKAAELRLQSEFKRLSEPLPKILENLEALRTSHFYIRHALIRSFLAQWNNELAVLTDLDILLANSFFSGKEFAEIRQKLHTIFHHTHPPHEGFKARNEAFVTAEKAKLLGFLPGVEKLTPEQQRAVIVHEDRNRLIAAAGSGKSSTLVAKVGYALRKGYVQPHEVLALAFNDDAAKELSERLENRLGIHVKAQTFHSFGKGVIHNELGQRSVLKGSGVVLSNQLEALLKEDAVYRTHFYLHHAIHQKSEPEQEFKSVEEYEAYIRKVGKRNKDKDTWGVLSLRGEHVRSFEELAIANWLYVNGVAYDYEKPYSHDLSGLGWKKYEPDFCYTLSDGSILYHEHFALCADGSSPFGRTYVSDVVKKRKLLADQGLALIETTSNDFNTGRVFIELEAKLKAYGIQFKPMSADEVSAALKIRPHKDFVRLISTLIAHAKETGLDERLLRLRGKKMGNQVRVQSFLALLFPLWTRYEAHLHNSHQIDFADMIGGATKLVEAELYLSPYKFILVDEFQDISRGRAALVRALLKQHEDSVLFAVGDDWQAINQFAGSDLSIMRNFEAEFGATETNHLSKTFRSNQGISNVAATFVRKNLNQLEKLVKANSPETEGVVRLVEFTDATDQQAKIKQKLQALAEKAATENRVISVMLIGRYKYETTNTVPYELIKQWNAEYAGFLTIQEKEKEKNGKSYREPLDTAHSSKGLEADIVLVHSLQARYFGFPSEIEDDPLLGLVLASREGYPYAEDRRLFYVALTRAKEEVTLYVSRDKPSGFVLELLEEEYKDMVVFEGMAEKPELCPECGQGYLVQKPGRRGPYLKCSASKFANCKKTKSIRRTSPHRITLGLPRLRGQT